MIWRSADSATALRKSSGMRSGVESVAAFPSSLASTEIPNFTEGGSLWLGFADPEVERAYCAELSFEILKRSKIFVRFNNNVYIFVIFIMLIYPASLPGWESGLSQAINFFFYTALLVGVNIWSRLKPSRRSEFGIVGIYSVLLVALLIGNPVRVVRLFPTWHELIPFAASGATMNAQWLNDCSADLVESARDTSRSLVVVSLHSLFYIFLRVRTKISLVMTVLVVLSASIPVLPSFQLNDEGNSYINFFVVLIACSGGWLGSRFTEEEHRTAWALRRQTEDFKKIMADREPMDALLHLVFP